MTEEKIIKTTARINENTKAFLKNKFHSVAGGAEQILAQSPVLAEEPIIKTHRDFSTGLQFAVSAFSTLYRRTLGGLKGMFSPAELSLLLDVSEDLMLTPQLIGKHLPAKAKDDINLDGLDQKWEVDKEMFLEKLEDLNLTQATALEIWCRAFWETIDSDKPVEAFGNYVKQLAE